MHVVTSTISVAFARELVRRHEAASVGYVAAPVLGRPDVAAKGELNVPAGGAPHAAAKVRPLERPKFIAVDIDAGRIECAR
ncbi:NAD(P)-binding domain-containing protein [Caballeronia glathei]|uniref:NAD(P)-binding domain-containing protein n=1 Tax=Caballeronia glathei TaxID=60547 RepID=UPI001E4A374A|nr:NAD(P)-binding domain-containing protein [Caballeronia glathei]